MLEYLIVGLIILFLIIVTLFFIKLHSLKDILNILELAKEKTRVFLNKKKETLDKIMEKINDNNFTKNIDLKEDDTIFNIDDILYKKRNLLISFLEEKKEINEEQKILLKDLSFIEENIDGLKDFYNKQVYTYNESLSKKPFSFLFPLFKLKKLKPWNINKLIEYTILKKD